MVTIEEAWDAGMLSVIFAASYISFYIANGAVVMPGFGIDRDEDARMQLVGLFPDREIVLDVFRLGTAQLAITVDGKEWRGNAIAPKVSVDDGTISGTANLGSPGAGKMIKADFNFRCR